MSQYILGKIIYKSPQRFDIGLHVSTLKDIIYSVPAFHMCAANIKKLV